MAVIQSIVFRKEYWNLKDAKKWLEEHNYKKSVDEKINTFRFRQVEPQKSFNYITKIIYHNKKPIEMIIGNK
jgi:hypothetical protein